MNVLSAATVVAGRLMVLPSSLRSILGEIIRVHAGAEDFDLSHKILPGLCYL